MRTKCKRIASLFRELAEAFDQLADEQPKKTRTHRVTDSASALRAVERIQENARREGVVRS